jgi:hypothetical protein
MVLATFAVLVWAALLGLWTARRERRRALHETKTTNDDSSLQHS